MVIAFAFHRVFFRENPVIGLELLFAKFLSMLPAYVSADAENEGDASSMQFAGSRGTRKLERYTIPDLKMTNGCWRAAM